MPRAARKKSSEYMYHVMSRSISEVDLFQNCEDKYYYLALLKRYKEKYQCKIYSYCLMDNHVHIFINPCGADISTFMLSLNTAYVCYFNRKYERHGHLFQGRFASTIVDNDMYSLRLSAYIHNNAKDLPGFNGQEELYQYSSFGIYTGLRVDGFNIVDTEFLLKLFSNNKIKAQQKFKAFTESMKGAAITKEVDESIICAYTNNEYKSEKSYLVRNLSPDELLHRIGEVLGEQLSGSLRLKYRRETSRIREFTVYILRILCGYSYKDLCEYIGNMSLSGIARLSNNGFKLLTDQILYRNAFNSLIQS